MNEFSNIKPIAQTLAQRGNPLPTKALDGKKLPAEPAPNLGATAVIPPETPTLADTTERQHHLEKAVDNMNHFVQNVKRDLQFSVDQELDQTVIKVVDSNTGKLIRQIPDDIFLELARKVKETGEMNLLHATG